MIEIRTLLFLQLRAFFDINKARYTKDPKEKSRCRTVLVAWTVILVMLFVYVGALVTGLCSLGLEEIVPAYLVVISSALILVFGIFTAGERIFSQRGYDILASMPVKPSSIVLSRFLAMYLGELFFAVAVMAAGVAAYGAARQPGLGFYVMALVAALFVPAIPMVITTVLGTLVKAIASRAKRKSLAQSLLSVLVVVGIMVLSFSMESMTKGMTQEDFFDLAETLNKTFGNIYPPAIWLNRALMEGNVLCLGLFILVSLGAAALTVLAVAKNFHKIQWRLSGFSAKHDYQISAMASRGLLKALYVREAKRYFASSIYVTNTILGPILAMIMVIALCVVGLDKLQADIPIDIAAALPFAFSGVCCMMTTTPCAISMEGRQIWVIQSLPLPVKTWLDSKLLLNLSLILPSYAVSVVAMAIGTKADILQLVWLAVIPAALILFNVVLGLTVNLKSHSFTWEQEVEVVKQSMPVAVSAFAGPLLAFAGGAAALLTPAAWGNLVRAAVCIILLALTALMYRRNNQVNISSL